MRINFIFLIRYLKWSSHKYNLNGILWSKISKIKKLILENEIFDSN